MPYRTGDDALASPADRLFRVQGGSSSADTGGISCVVKRLRDDCWHRVLDEFQDANIMQTVPFVTTAPGLEMVEHLVLRRSEDLIAAAQIRLIRVPLVGQSIAYVLRGPLCRSNGGWAPQRALHLALRALREEYVGRRRMSLRIAPGAALREDVSTASYAEEGYRHVAAKRASRTVILDLTRPLDTIRRGFEKKWRNCLNQAERNGLSVSEGSGDSLIEQFLTVYRQMLSRKQLAEPGDIRRFRLMQSMLPDRFKMQVILVADRGEPCAGVICSAIGRQGLYLFGATGNVGLSNKASYLAQWRAIQWLKEQNCAEYDLHGIDQKSNPGVYAFKMGLCGTNGREVEFAGHFDLYAGRWSRFVLTGIDMANRQYKTLRQRYERSQGFTG
jgi:lipid II:glycine glycyltransferase (peptidoglycan interpeptide bridge formation enzyme)